MEEHLYPKSKKAVNLAILVAALGYFVDIYDLLLFSIVRIKSLIAIGVPEAHALDSGVFLLNMQMGGMLIGGILWGILGDKKGRLSVLFGSIFLYSVANIANGFVQDITTYSFLRLIAGIGLAGELGAGITLVSEIMPKEKRGIGTTIIATIGVLGAVLAAIIAKQFEWRTCYFIGGGMGIALLLLRIGVYESGMFNHVKTQAISRGNFFSLFSTRKKAFKYARVILIGLSTWYVVGILITFSPEFGKAFGMTVLPSSGDAVMYCYIGLSAGDLASGLLSQLIKSRKKVMAIFLSLSAVCTALYFTVAGSSLGTFYTICGLLGFSVGFWAIFVTIASEQFGTNIRATVTTTTPNFVRGALVPIAWLFTFLKEPVGIIGSGIAVGVLVLTIACISLIELEETFGKDLHYIES
jgi:MFS transporter, putative metabolite:H+ symporter